MNINKKFYISGRYAIKNNVLSLFHGGSSISFKMSGDSFTLSMRFATTQGYFYIIINRDYENKIKVYLDNNGYTYTFSKKDIYYVDIIKANECNMNILLIEDIKVNGELFDYDHEYNKKVRIYGDSTVAGYGILAKEGEGNIHNSDSVSDFIFNSLYELNMGIDIFSASGWGLTFSNYTSPKNIGIINFINKVGPNLNIDYKDAFKEDLLIISLGTNDDSYIKANIDKMPTLVDYFIKQYEHLIKHELKKNKELKILMVYGTLKEEQAYYLVEQTYNSLKSKYPYLFIHKFNGDKTAISNHAFVSQHKIMCEELKTIIKELLR